MKKSGILTILMFLLSLNFVNSDINVGYSSNDGAFVDLSQTNQTTSYNITTTYTNVTNNILNSTNYSDFWDGYDTPDDIPEHIYWYNQSINSAFWKDYFDDAITTLQEQKNIYLFSNISFNNSGGSGILGYTETSVDINFTFDSTTETTYSDFSDGTRVNINLTSTGEVKLENETSYNYFNKGNYTSNVFDLGNNANLSTLNFTYDIPHSSYYPQDGLKFGWDGSNAVNYVNTSIIGTLNGGLLAGNTNVNGTGAHVIDNNATKFNRTSTDNIYFATYDIGSGENYTYSIWFKIDEVMYAYADYMYSFIGTSDNSISMSIYMENGRVRGRLGGCNNYFEYDLKVPSSDWYDWHMYTLRVANASIFEHYIDGELIEAEAPCTINPTLIGTTNLYIGSYVNGLKAWNGTLDEFHIWNRTLSAGEINEMYNLSKEGVLKLQTRTDNTDILYANWSDNYLVNGSEYLIQNLTSPYRYFQYKADFQTLNGNVTPILNSVNFSYISNTTTIITPQPIYGNTSNLTTIYSREGELWIKGDILDNKILTSTGTIGYVGKWTSSNILSNSIILESLGEIDIAGNLEITGDYKVNGNTGITKTINLNETCSIEIIGGIITDATC